MLEMGKKLPVITSTVAQTLDPEHGSPSGFDGHRQQSTVPVRPFWFDLRIWVRDVMISVVIATVVIVFLYQPVKVEGTSMMPWLEDQERVFVNKFIYGFDPIRRGDVIVFRFPLDPRKSYIKRVAGLPGDQVAILNGRLVLNGKITAEPYLRPEYSDSSSYPTIEVPEDHFYVLGDHRNTSNDSRNWGTIERSSIIGQAVFSYWPFDRIGSLVHFEVQNTGISVIDRAISADGVPQ